MISIIIPTLNEEKTIERTLSVFSEFHIPHEVIVSDGKSTDMTIAIARKHNAKVVLYTGNTRQTIAHGRNLGASVATGEYLVFIDADVIIPDVHNFFTKLIDVFNTQEKIVGLTVNQRALPEHETMMDRFFFKIINYTFFILNNILHFGGSSGEFQMIRNDVFKKVGGFDDTIAVGEDNELFQRLAKIGRTKIESSLYILHTARRVHKVGWPKLLVVWLLNWFSNLLLKRSFHSVWEEIR